MMRNILLDVISPDGSYRRPRRPRIIEQVIDTVSGNTDKVDSISSAPDSLSGVAPDSLSGVAPDVVGDSLSQVNMLNDMPVGGDDSSTLLWTILMVAAALAVCIGLAMAYRRRNSITAR